MIFSNNYDKLKQAQTIYNKFIGNNPILKQIDDVTDFFSVCFKSLNESFSSIYDYLITKNTKNNVVKNYGIISSDSEEGKQIDLEIEKNVKNANIVLKDESELNYVDLENLNISYSIGDLSYSLKSENNALMFSLNSHNSKKHTIAFITFIDEKPFLVIKQNSLSINKYFCDKTETEMFINPYTQNLIYAKEKRTNIKSTGNTDEDVTIIAYNGKDYLACKKQNGMIDDMGAIKDKLIFNSNCGVENYFNNNLVDCGKIKLFKFFELSKLSKKYSTTINNSLKTLKVSDEQFFTQFNNGKHK